MSRFTETIVLSHETIAATPQKSAVGPQPFYSEYAISAHQILRAEICFINGLRVVRLSRLKRTAAGNEKRTGSVLEFGAHRTRVVASLIADIERELGRLANASA